MTTNWNDKLDSEWSKIHNKAISKLQQYLTTGDKQVMFTKKEYMEVYTCVYDLCICQVEFITGELYKRYSESIRDYLIAEVYKRLNF